MKKHPLNSLVEGSRVWTFQGFTEHGRRKITVPPETGGTIRRQWREFSTIEQDLYDVEWNSGESGTHYAGELSAIGKAKTAEEFFESILSQALSAKLVLGPQGGFRGFTIHLRGDEWIDGYVNLRPRLESAGVPVEVEKLKPKPPTRKWTWADSTKNKKPPSR